MPSDAEIRQLDAAEAQAAADAATAVAAAATRADAAVALQQRRDAITQSTMMRLSQRRQLEANGMTDAEWAEATDPAVRTVLR